MCATRSPVCVLLLSLSVQIDKNPTQVENIHNVLAAAASRFTPHHLDHLFLMIQKSWESGSDRYRVGLLKLIGRIGRDDRTGKTATKVHNRACLCLTTP